MRKKFAAFWATLVLCLLVAVPAFAAKPALQAYVTFSMNSVGGVSPTVHYRNNTGKTIKYIHWYMTPYNAVNDKVKSEIGNYAYGKETGPIAPFSAKLEEYGDNYAVFDGSLYSVGVDSYGCPCVYLDWKTYYLTDSEVNNYVLDREAYFECMWYNWNIDHIVLDKAVIIYMDGSQKTVSGSSLTMNNFGVKPQNNSFENQKEHYEDVYAYSQYRAYNPDLVAVFGEDEHKYLEHFISNGMKEGRRGNYEFDLVAYKENNPDLVAVFGDDNQKYYEHYISSGKSEGRSALSAKPEFEITDWKLIRSGTSPYGSDINVEIDYRNNTGRTIEQVKITAYKQGSYYISTYELKGPIEPQTTGHGECKEKYYISSGSEVEIRSVTVTYTDGLTEEISPERVVSSGVTKLKAP